MSACNGDSSNTDTNTSPVNNAPTIGTTFSDISLIENNGTTNYEINVNDSNGDALTLTVESNDTSIITVDQNWTGTINQARYSTPLDFNLTTVIGAYGLAKITINLGDGQANTTTSFDVNVTKIFKSGDTWKGLEYNTTTSPYTNRVWLDRNLGAMQVCTAPDDTACYGDYYQWGRDADGHENNESDTNTTLATDLNTSGNNKFITNGSDPWDWVENTAQNNNDVDDNGSLRSANWSKTDGSSIYPVGYRAPTKAELAAETTGATTPIVDNIDAFNSFLKLPSAGYHNHYSGSLDLRGSDRFIWSSSPSGSYAEHLNFNSGVADWYYQDRARGESVRCIKD